MKKTILITGATDGIGYLTAKSLIEQGHDVLIHGRDEKKLQRVYEELSHYINKGTLEFYLADLSVLSEVKSFAKQVKEKHIKLDVLINNAGIYKTPVTKNHDGFDIRFAVNTIAPYLLTKELLALFESSGRVVNLSSAAQAPVDLEALKTYQLMGDAQAYAQSKLAITMWTNYLSNKRKENEPNFLSINPKSLLASKMVKEAYGIEGSDLSVGADILVRASLSDEFENANGKYYDNDVPAFAIPHLDALNLEKCEALVNTLEELI